MNAKRWIWIALAAGLVLSGTAQAGKIVIVNRQPPAVRVDLRPVKPFSQAVWLPGHWAWRSGRYVWEAGRWTRPRAGHAYISGHWAKRRGGWVWVPGHWVRR